MIQQDTFLPMYLERFIDFTSRNKILIIAIIGYGSCRCASGLPFWLLASSSMSTVNNAGKIIGMLLFLIVAYAFDKNHMKFWILVLPSLVALCGCFILLTTYYAIPSFLTGFSLGAFLFGAGTACVMLQWLEYISCISLKRIALTIGIAEILNSLVLVVTNVGGSLALTYLFFLIAISLFLLLWFRRICDIQLAPSLSFAQRSLTKLKRLISLRLVVWVSVYCFSYGLINTFIDASMFSVSDNLGNMLPGFTIILIAIFLPDQFDIRMLKNIAFVFMVSGILFLGFFDINNTLIQLFAGAGAASCRLFAYSLACMRARMNRTSALPACTLVKCLIIIMMIFGSNVGALDLPVDRTLLVASITFAVSVLSVCLSPFNVDEQHVLDLATHSSTESKHTELMVVISAEKKLSKREKTIFTLMAKGNDIATISDELFISKSAVRAHTSRIYAKFGIHNRQDFDALMTLALQDKED